MTIYKYDGTINGIFSCIFESFMSDEFPIDIIEQPSDNCFSIIKTIKTEQDKTRRAIHAFIDFAGEIALNEIQYSFKSEKPGKAHIIFSFIRKTLERRCDISNDFSCKEVLYYYNLIKEIGSETRYYKKNLSFSVADDGVYYATLSPYNDISDMLARYFYRILYARPFVIHDQKRNVITMINNDERKIIKIENIEHLPYSEEKLVLELWKNYFPTSDISDRQIFKNLKPINTKAS